jgi:virginiamycin B lyase
MLVATSLAAQESNVQIDQWKLPWNDANGRDPYVAPDGRIWFVGQGAGNYLAVFDPKTAAFDRFALPDSTIPHSNIISADGIVWVAGNRNGTIVRFDPKTKVMKQIRMPAGVRDPHTMVFDGKGGMWFTAQNSHFVGHMNLTTEVVRVVKTSDSTERTGPYGIVVDNNGVPWFDLFATNKIGTIDPASMKLRTFTLPDGARPRRIGRTSDGIIWYTDHARGHLGRLDPKTGAVEEFPSPSLAANGRTTQLYAMTVDDADRVWYVETSVIPNRMIGFDSKMKKVVYNAAVPGDGRNVVRHMVFDPKTRLIWYGADLRFLGAVKVPPKPVM